MLADERRQAILEIISENKQPVTGSYLAGMLDVSRQVIVQDIAILRAAGNDIIATPQGYMLSKNIYPKRYQRVIACKHQDDGIEDELMTIVDLGGTVLDVSVEHRVYGEFRARLMIKSPSDVRSFIEIMKREKAEPLCALTEGVHLHTVEADTPGILDKVERALEEKGYLLSQQ
ncbi:MAG: transcription repressor NadR [Clostridiales bacterium]|jgi:transcriptional regulator of NAD metabolism|nr:transcription repressor NadR [Clostridiales bacterium]